MIHRKQGAIALTVIEAGLQAKRKRSAFAMEFFPEQNIITEIGAMAQ
jgi:hypothetical protein